MKFFLWFFGAIGALILLVVVLFFLNEHKGGWGRALNESLSATTTDPNANRTAPAPPTREQIHEGYLKSIESAAQSSGIAAQVTGYERKDYQIAVIWPGEGSEPGVKFLNTLHEQGILENSEVVQAPVSGLNAQGQRVSQAIYKVRLK